MRVECRSNGKQHFIHNACIADARKVWWVVSTQRATGGGGLRVLLYMPPDRPGRHEWTKGFVVITFLNFKPAHIERRTQGWFGPAFDGRQSEC